MDNVHTDREKSHILMNLLKAVTINSTQTGANVGVNSKSDTCANVDANSKPDACENVATNSKPDTCVNVEVNSKQATVADDDTRLELMLQSFKYLKGQIEDGKITVPDVDEEKKARLDRLKATTDGLMMTLEAEEKGITCIESSIYKKAEKISDFEREFQSFLDRNTDKLGSIQKWPASQISTDKKAEKISDFEREFQSFLDRNKDKLGSIQKWPASQISTEELLKHVPDFELELTRLFQKNRTEIYQMLKEADDLDEQIDIQIQQLQEMYTKLLPFYNENKELLQRCLNSRDNNAQSRESLKQLDGKISQLSEKLEENFKIYFKNNKKPGKAIAGFFSVLGETGKTVFKKSVSDLGEKT